MSQKQTEKMTCPMCDRSTSAELAWCEHCGAKLHSIDPDTIEIPAIPEESERLADTDTVAQLYLCCEVHTLPLLDPAVEKEMRKIWEKVLNDSELEELEN